MIFSSIILRKENVINHHWQPFWILKAGHVRESTLIARRERDGERKMKVMVTQQLYQWNLRSCRSDQFRPSRAVQSRVGRKKRKEMQTGMRGKRCPSRRVFVCYCDITSLEEQLQMVSTVTEQSDTSPLIHSDSWIRLLAARESSAKETLQIELALQPRLVKEHLSPIVCVSIAKKFKLCRWKIDTSPPIILITDQLFRLHHGISVWAGHCTVSW